mmetsp:Transcript_18535/g.53841  ORF Transcript_18535/g.53841 Transcript_18535/m.53841 type:complete len:539 (-) Transcript_18535:76-1692(-)|eukprot:CAMPEP_0168380164 /NCGR_PEP_ID=MMETSP0228-20121227/12217_1 /TAXON_ID=133427 /ORGANISM="Protoceratium reticulatum, Strain CCCM 535 (=CCMP 1889)" /LENGTH=538 /DNA_ID=CAMNT_0008393217 /DNA_START=148 /DNA_END=1764 /DNA_ORIENTATION=-
MGSTCSCDGEEDKESHFEQLSDNCTVIDDDKALHRQFGRDTILGCSSIGTVIKTRRRGSKVVRAVKRIMKRNIEGSNWKKEVQTLQKLDHPHVCKLHDTLEDLMSVYLIMELCQGGNLMNISANQDRFSEATVAVLVLQMASAIAHLHAHDIVHSDIRPENWLFEAPVQPRSSVLDMTLKMIDFGLASKHGRRLSKYSDLASEDTESTPTPPQATGRRPPDLRDFRRGLCCVAPEQLGRGADGKADIFALGVLSYFLLSGQSPFELSAGVTSLEDHFSFRNARFVFMPSEVWRPISMEAKNFVALCLQKDPERRPSATAMLGLPWMRLAKEALEEEHVLRSQGKRLGPSTCRLSTQDPPLPSARNILSALERMKRMQVLEKAAIIFAARSVHSDSFPLLQKTFEGMDSGKKGVLPIAKLIQGLTKFGVNISDLEEVEKEAQAGKLEYVEFIADVGAFQRNMQDGAVCEVFNGFGSAKDGVKKKSLAVVLGQASHQNVILDAFPLVDLQSVVQELKNDASGTIDFESFQQVLRESRRNS